MKQFVLEDFLIELEQKLSKIDFESTSSCINDNANNVIAVFKDVLNLDAPLHPMTI